MTEIKYLRIAQSITQEYIEKYGVELDEIDEMDTMIADAIEKAVNEEFADFFHNLDSI